MPNKSDICHFAITAYRRRDYKRGSISRTNFCHSISASCVWGDFAFQAHSDWGRKMWNSAKFIALAMSASSGTLSSAFDNAVLNASEMREEA
jgi:hypothetical protein